MVVPCIDTWRGVLEQARSAVLEAFGRETREAAALRQAAEIADSPPITDPLQRILEAALPVVPSDHLVLLQVSSDRTEFVILAAAGTARVWRWVRGPLGRGVASRAVETGQAQLASEETDAEETSVGPVRSGIAVPVMLRGTVYGVIATADERRRFTKRHVNLLRAFADHCATAIDDGRTGKGSGVTVRR